MDGFDSARLPEIHIPESEVPKRFGSYQLRVIEEGHIPRMLSGMRGTAPEFGGKYAKSRSAVEEWARETYGIRAAKVLVNRRWTKVWTDSTGNFPIRLRIMMGGQNEEGA
ncbi:hypothetical protein D893_02690 [Thioalkalivibrio sp. ALE21]|uniref:hypothetical protein n=1 Tax=Thioalkalivibrio sp. ALE21 TaxID=1158175 RepID=UPI000D9934D6|nr:hypothetical protein [Thioalkalivibrio sp. ALE21]PYF99284.1 hypothetical protein D893_02690 [Thioalkalivibrio sp. ALE21]